MTTPKQTDNVDVLRARLRVIKQVAVVDELLERLVTNPDTNQLDQALGRAVAKLRKAEHDLMTAVYQHGGPV